MDFQLLAPAAPLDAWVAAAVHVAFDSPGGEPMPCHFPALVEGGVTAVLSGQFLVPSPAGDFIALPAGFVSSASAQPLTLYRTPRLCCVGLRLHPAATQALLQASPASLPQHVADASDVFGRRWSLLVDRMLAASDPARRMELLLQFAAERLCHDRHADRLRRALQLQSCAMRRASPERLLGISDRHFERVFPAVFGLRPKLFQRVARVEQLLRDALPSGRTDADLALRHSYYDQSHLARDLRTLAGASLRSLVAAVREPDSGHWPLAVGTSRRRTPP